MKTPLLVTALCGALLASYATASAQSANASLLTSDQFGLDAETLALIMPPGYSYDTSGSSVPRYNLGSSRTMGMDGWELPPDDGGGDPPPDPQGGEPPAPMALCMANGFPISLDYSGPGYGYTADPGWTNLDDYNIVNYFANYFGETLPSYTTNSFSITVVPNRDQLDPSTRVPHYCSFQMGLMGPYSDTMTVALSNGTYTNQVIIVQHGPGWPSYSTTLFPWTTWSFHYYDTNDLTLTFTYTTGNIYNAIGNENRGGVDHFCWEAVPVIGQPQQVRIEGQFQSEPNLHGPFGEIGDNVKVSWTRATETYINATNTLKLEFTTNEVDSASWMLGSIRANVFTDPTGLRYESYFSRHLPATFFRLHKQ